MPVSPWIRCFAVSALAFILGGLFMLAVSRVGAEPSLDPDEMALRPHQIPGGWHSVGAGGSFASNCQELEGAMGGMQGELSGTFKRVGSRACSFTLHLFEGRPAQTDADPTRIDLEVSSPFLLDGRTAARMEQMAQEEAVILVKGARFSAMVHVTGLKDLSEGGFISLILH